MSEEPKDPDVLVQQALADRRNLRKIVSLLYDSDMHQRFLAAKALGELAKVKPDLVSQVWRRILNATDDTMSCWGVSEGLGEIARNLPDLRGKIALRLGRFRKDESTCQGFIWAVCRIAQVEKETVSGFVQDLPGFLDSGDACMVGQTLWALGELRMVEAEEKMKGFLSDTRETWIYENDHVSRKTLGEMAAEALEKLHPFQGLRTS